MLNHLLQRLELAILLVLIAGSCRYVWRFFTRRQLIHQELSQQLQSFMDQCSAVRNEYDLKHQLADWPGFQEFKIINRQTECEGVISLYLALKSGDPLPGFFPGQYVIANIKIPGQSTSCIRCFSLSNDPDEKSYYRLTVKRCGVASAALYDHYPIGSIIKLKAPRGHFILKAPVFPQVFIAEGIGISPVFSMLSHSVNHHADGDTWLFYIVENRASHVFKQELQLLREEHPNLKIHVIYNNPRFEDSLGDDYNHIGPFSVDLLSVLLPSSNYHYYLCCSSSLLIKTITDLRKWGVPKSDYLVEAYDTETLKSLSQLDDGPIIKSDIDVQFARSSITASWTPESGSILEFAESLGIKMNYGCRVGRCGSCSTKLDKGNVRYLLKPEAEIIEGRCLPCIALPVVNCVIDA